MPEPLVLEGKLSEPWSGCDGSRQVQFAVVTKIPDDAEPGNWTLGAPIGHISGHDERGLEIVKHVPTQIFLKLRTAVFSLGEILILDDSGREVAGKGRKPSAWRVAIKSFPTIEEAVTCARKVAG